MLYKYCTLSKSVETKSSVMLRRLKPFFELEEHRWAYHNFSIYLEILKRRFYWSFLSFERVHLESYRRLRPFWKESSVCRSLFMPFIPHRLLRLTRVWSLSVLLFWKLVSNGVLSHKVSWIQIPASVIHFSFSSLALKNLPMVGFEPRTSVSIVYHWIRQDKKSKLER